MTKPMNPASRTFPEASRFQINAADARINGSNPPRRSARPAAPALVECTSCKGTGKVSVGFIEMGKPEVRMELTCVSCDGAGKITLRQRAALQAEDDMWCRCEASSGSQYVPDSRHAKHHWRCDDCGSVTQIG